MSSQYSIPKEMADAAYRKGSTALMLLFSLLVVLGAGAFLIGLSSDNPLRAWQAYLINFAFWTGLASGTTVLSAIFVLTNAKWGRPIKRLAESFGAFLPVSFALFWVLWFGKELIFPWVRDPVPEKAGWLNSTFLFSRDGISLFLLATVALAFIYRSANRDEKALAAGTTDLPDSEKFSNSQSALATVFIVLYAFLLSLLAFDLMMSLSPNWYSTLFGAYYFMTSIYMGLAALMIFSAIAMTRMNLGGFVKENQLYNLGKLLLGFCVVSGDFFYVQFIVQWYGNIPEETRYMILRVYMQPWRTLSWMVFFGFFIIPFIVLLKRSLKMKPIPMMILSLFILSAMWLEKVLIVAPSIWNRPSIPIGWMEVLITAGFFGLVALSILLFLRRFPVLPVSDPWFHKALVPDEHHEAAEVVA